LTDLPLSVNKEDKDKSGISRRLSRHAKATPSAGSINKWSPYCRIQPYPAKESFGIAGFEMICNTIAPSNHEV